MEGMGKEKLHFSLLELAECQRSFREKCFNFITNVANNSQVHQKIPFVNLKTQLYCKGQTVIYHCISGV